MIQKNYFTFNELLARWGCEKKDIHYLISQGELTPSIVWDGLLDEYCWVPGGQEEGNYLGLKDPMAEPFPSSGCGWLYLKSPNISGPYENYYFHFATKDRFPSEKEFEGGWYCLVESGSRASGSLHYGKVRGVELEGCAVFMAEEVDDTEVILRPELAPKSDKAAEVEQSVSDSPKKTGKDLSTTERNTLLTIIAALCNYSKIKTDDRGAARKIAEMTEEIGAAVSDDTVRRWLKVIPEAMEIRMK